jgi:hypothetical protein
MLPVFLDCPFLIAPSVFSNVYLLPTMSCVLCTQCCQCLWIVHSWLLLRFPLTFIYYLLCPAPWVPNVTRISRLSILDCSFGFLLRLFTAYYVLCLVYPMLSVSLDCPFLITPSVFSNVYLLPTMPCALCTQCYPCLWTVHSWLLLRFSLTFIYYLLCPAPCVPNVARVSGLSILDCLFGFL